MNDDLYDLVEERLKNNCPVPEIIKNSLKNFSKRRPEFDTVEWWYHSGVCLTKGNMFLVSPDDPDVQELQKFLESLPEEIHLYLSYFYKRSEAE